MRITLPSPATAIAVVALGVSLSGTGVAATLIDPSAHAAKSQRGPRGPRGLRGPRGFTGATGATGAAGATGATGARGPLGVQGQPGIQGDPGTPGAAGPTAYLGHIAGLTMTPGVLEYAVPDGYSQAESSSVHFRFVLGPPVALTLRTLSVNYLQEGAGAGLTRTFHLNVNGTDVEPGCTIPAGSPSCSVILSTALPALARIYLDDTATGTAMAGDDGDAAFSWTAS